MLKFWLIRSTCLVATLLCAVSQADAQGASRAQPPARPAASSSDAAPDDATGRCRDGTFVTDAAVATACSARGGLLVAFPARRIVPPRPISAEPVASRPAMTAMPEGSAGPTGVPVAAAPPAAPQAASPHLGVPVCARARCRDGTYISDSEPAAACKAHSGVAVVFPTSAAPPDRAARAERGAESPVFTRPSGATAQCKDGSYLVTTPNESSCAANGGIAAILPAEPQAPRAEPAVEAPRSGPVRPVRRSGRPTP